MRRAVLNTLVILVALAAMTLGAAYLYARRSLPALDGTIVAAGLAGPIEIVRDADAIPHIFATAKRDVLYGLGYVHAQDRLWQMEFQRRVGFGRLSEIFGEATVPQDRFLRTVGYGRTARAAWSGMAPGARAEIEAYVAGVNAFIAAHRGSRLPPEFTLLRFAPEPFDGADVVVWQKMLAWDLSGNYALELLRRDLAARVGTEALAELMPPYARDGLSILPWLKPPGVARATSPAVPDGREAPFTGRAASWSTAFARGISGGHPAVRDLLLGGTVTEALGSNNWVVDGTLTASGKPLLANDPHLSSRIPSTWYLVHLSAGSYDAIGASIPGTPAIVLGRNRFIAWGATNVAADVEDLYQERLDPTGRFAEFRGRQEPLKIIPETIIVKGGPPVAIEVRISRHGPLVSDAINANNAATAAGRTLPALEPLAFRWTALDPGDSTTAASMRMSEARNWEEFTAALSDFVVPSQNFVYADTAGHIGYYAPGRIPIRARGDGALPSPGWTGDSEWTGWVPFDDLPHAFDPPGHAIVTANQRPMPAAYPYLLGVDWPEPYRAQRITDLLRASPRLTPAVFATIQADRLSLHAQAVLPVLLGRATPESAADRQAIDLLRQWHGDAGGGSAAAAIFEAWFLRLAPALLTDDLGAAATASYEGRYSFVTRFLIDTLTADAAPAEPAAAHRRGSAHWCDDSRTPARETCAAVVTATLHDAVQELTGRLGNDLTRWRWDSLHRAVFPHSGLDSVASLRALVSRSVPSAGDWSTVNVGAVAADRRYDQMAAPGYREIIDLGSVTASRFMDAVGASGHFLSPHYDDFLSDWAAVKYRPMRMERADIEQGAIGHLRLVPR
ncbi:MAG: penicillin acylase family protein [Acidobacteriota bacterium]